ILRNLNCSAGVILEYKKNEQNKYFAQPIFSIPRSAENIAAFRSALKKIPSQSDLAEITRFCKELPLVESIEDGFFFQVMELPNFGLLILIKANSPLEQQLINSLKPIGKKLAGACIAYRQNEKMAQLINQLKIENEERRKAEKALRESYELFKTVMDSIDATIYVADMDTYEIIFANQHMQKSFGNKLEGEICYRIFRNKDYPCANCSNTKLVDSSGKSLGVYTWEGQSIISKKWYINFDRAIKWIDGRLVRLQIATDITKLKQMEEELRQSHKMDSIGTLVGGVAHDFNNILFMISGNAELLLEDIPEWNPSYAQIEAIKSASLRASGIVRQLLNFSRKTDQNLVPIDALTVILDAINFLRSSIPSTIEVYNELPIPGVVILADPIQINQVLMNICTNAWQAMETTGGTLNIKAETITLDDDKNYSGLSNGEYLKIEIKDSGPGITPDVIEKIFDPYFTTKKMGEGSGMGLSVVLGIIKNHNGTITVDSKPGTGTTFTILFPVIDEKPNIQIEKAEPLLSGTETILFIDDEVPITKMISQMLKKIGYNVQAKTNPIEALELFNSQPDLFDLVITDMTMPQMTGSKLSEKLKLIRPDIPIIICTGHSSLIDEKKAQELGVSGFLMKPIEKRELALAIQKVLNKKRLQSKDLFN
ncbi:MAG: response regulator, partial [Desulfobacteraceae bacterium]|nr:response regulator [Desulfobacteraceae bacterium]